MDQPLNKQKLDFDNIKTDRKARVDEQCNNKTSFQTMKYAGTHLELMHEGFCDTKEELLHCEGNLVSTTPSCVNKQIADNLLADVNGYQHQNRHDTGDALRGKIVCDICGGKFTHANNSNHLNI